jgi:transposase InsO family protein
MRVSSHQTRPRRNRRNLLAATLARFVDAKRARNDRHPTRTSFPLFRRPARRAAPDPVALAVFVIDEVGPAAVRACASGVEVSVCAADEPTAAVIRAALDQTARHRPTDRLVRVVSD